MPFGRSTYDDVATEIRTRHHAGGVFLIVIDGDRGTGIAGQLSAVNLKELPTVPRSIADQVERDEPPT